MPVTISASKGEAILTLGQAVGAGKRARQAPTRMAKHLGNTLARVKVNQGDAFVRAACGQEGA